MATLENLSYAGTIIKQCAEGLQECNTANSMALACVKQVCALRASGIHPTDVDVVLTQILSTAQNVALRAWNTANKLNDLINAAKIAGTGA